MKINDVVSENKLDELTAGEVGTGLGKGVRAVGTGIADFAKGFGQGLMGKTGSTAPSTAPQASKAAGKGAAPSTSGSDPLASIKSAITKLSPKQRAALRTQIAKKAGVK